MCGILATVNVPFDQAALDSIRHRGPDASGISQIAVGKHLVTLGHQRLSILDVSPAGHQPMWACNRRFAIVYNGEIYNHQELRQTLAHADYRGHSDTETILHCLAERGIKSASEFNGIFAFCLLDAKERKLYVARDPFGVKPVYYRAEAGTVVVSSELRGIRQFFSDTLDPDSLAELLRLRYLPAPDTLFRNVRKLRPGHVAEIDLNAAAPRISEYPLPRPSDRGAPVRDDRSASAESPLSAGFAGSAGLAGGGRAVAADSDRDAAIAGPAAVRQPKTTGPFRRGKAASVTAARTRSSR